MKFFKDKAKKVEKQPKEQRLLIDSRNKKFIKQQEDLRKLFAISTRISIKRVSHMLDIEQKALIEMISNLTSEFNIKIEGDYLSISKDDLDGFIDALDNQYKMWELKEKDGIGKIDKTLSMLKCPECGADIRPTYNVCIKCGEPLLKKNKE